MGDDYIKAKAPSRTSDTTRSGNRHKKSHIAVTHDVA